MSWTQRLHQLGIQLPEPPKPVAAYIPAIRVGNLIYVSGQLPLLEGQLLFAGSVPEAVSIEQAQAAARQCLLNGLAAGAAVVGGPEFILGILQISGFVQSASGFSMHPQVINGASEFALDLMGDDGKHARIAVGVSSLPLNAPVEISFVFRTAGLVG